MFVECTNVSDPTSANSHQGNTETSGGYTKKVADVLAKNFKNHDNDQDYFYENSQLSEIKLGNNGITASSVGAAVDGNKVTITSSGLYRLTGALPEGQVIVDTNDKGVVKLLLDGLTIHNSKSAPIYIKNICCRRWFEI